MPGKTFLNLIDRLDRKYGWHKLPKLLGIVTLVGLRDRLRAQNLFDSGVPGDAQVVPDDERRYLRARTIDGTFNDLEQPFMGAVGSRFGRNVPPKDSFPEKESDLMSPNPRIVSRELMTRDHFTPAESLNVLAAAWLQFEVHDWFSHVVDKDNFWEVPLEESDPWPEHPMKIRRTHPDSTMSDALAPPVYRTPDSHWWDGSQIYGSEKGFAEKVRAREGGKLRIDDQGLLPRDLEEGLDYSGVPGNFWVGLGILHTLFTKEHNAICDRLRAEYPTWTDDELYDRARLINSALMAKIHTIEWTPAIISHPTTKMAMKVNWWGLAGEKVHRRFGRISGSEVISGIPGAKQNHHGVPYSLTEEFAAVYRMHPLLPDDFDFYSVRSGELLQQRTFPELGALQARERMEELTISNAAYSLGIAHPGAIMLHNFPRFLQHLDRADGTIMDLAATDILRIRERGVPRYNRFRELFRLPPANDFEDLTDNPEWVREIRSVYENDINSVDLMTGLYAERPPKGFGFSDTAFRVFILMASRRLESDRYFTTDYKPEIYTQAGLEWIDNNTMITVLLRHYPELEPALSNIDNAFVPWNRVD
jgi:hypothetical protein